MNQQQDIEQKYNDLLSKYRKVIWTSITSVAALAGTVLYSKYQIFRKEKVIDQKQNQIKNQRDELDHLRHETKKLNTQLMEEFKVILKNLKSNILNDPNVTGFSTALKNQIHTTFEEMNGTIHNKLEALKSYNYKEAMEKWYLANMVSNQGFKFNTLRKIEVVQANWKHYKDSINEGYTWRSNGNHSFSGMTQAGVQYKPEFQKMRAYFEKKNGYEGKGVEVNANIDNLGNSFVGSKKALYLKYRCWGFDIKTGLFTVPLQAIKPASEEEPDLKIERIDEGKEKYIDCKDNEWTRKE